MIVSKIVILRHHHPLQLQVVVLQIRLLKTIVTIAIATVFETAFVAVARILAHHLKLSPLHQQPSQA